MRQVYGGRDQSAVTSSGVLETCSWTRPSRTWTGWIFPMTQCRRNRVEGEETDAMLRARAGRGNGGWGAQARRVAGALSPVAVSPAAPRETVAMLDAWGPSLMPRSARARGMAMGLGILGARATRGGRGGWRWALGSWGRGRPAAWPSG